MKIEDAISPSGMASRRNLRGRHICTILTSTKSNHTDGYCWRTAIEITTDYPEIKF